MKFWVLFSTCQKYSMHVLLCLNGTTASISCEDCTKIKRVRAKLKSFLTFPLAIRWLIDQVPARLAGDALDLSEYQVGSSFLADYLEEV